MGAIPLLFGRHLFTLTQLRRRQAGAAVYTIFKVFVMTRPGSRGQRFHNCAIGLVKYSKDCMASAAHEHLNSLCHTSSRRDRLQVDIAVVKVAYVSTIGHVGLIFPSLWYVNYSRHEIGYDLSNKVYQSKMTHD